MKTTDNGLTFEVANWETHDRELYAIRRTVFVEEQGVPEDMERDPFDTECWHVLARNTQGHPIGTGRLLHDGHIGRVAVLKSWRGKGIGRALMLSLIELSRQKGFSEVRLNAQTRVLNFYRALGFEPCGEEFLEAGIPHRRMRLRL